MTRPFFSSGRIGVLLLNLGAAQFGASTRIGGAWSTIKGQWHKHGAAT